MGLNLKKTQLRTVHALHQRTTRVTGQVMTERWGTIQREGFKKERKSDKGGGGGESDEEGKNEKSKKNERVRK